MRRFFVPADTLREGPFELPVDVVQHLQVLRLGVGDKIELLDGKGLVCTARLEAFERRRVIVQVLDQRQEEESAFPVHLLQGLPKGDKLEFVLQKGVELGATRITPVVAGRSIARAGVSPTRLLRWQKVVQEAARQSRRVRLPTLDPPSVLGDGLALVDAPLRLMLWEDGATPLRSVLPEKKPRSAAVLVGPEGGFSAAEAEQAQGAGFVPVHLGPRILRTETAGLAAVTLLQYHYGDLDQGVTPGGST